MSNGINGGGIPNFDEWAKLQGLDPMTMQPIKPGPTFKKVKAPPTFEMDPIIRQSLATSPSPVEDEETLYSLRKRGIDVYADSDLDELLEARAEKQGVGEVAANAALRFQVGLLGELASTAGGIIDAPFDIARALRADIEFGNALTQFGDEWKRKTDEDWFPIYRSQDRDFMDVGDPEWWLENGSSIARSAAGFVATGVGLGKGLQALGGLAKTARGIPLLEALRMAPEAAAMAGRGIQTGINAYLLNHAEGVMEATDVYNTTYDNWIQRGATEEEAKEKASLGASATVNANRINLLLNLTSAGKFLKPLGSARNILEMPSFKKGLKEAALEGGQEFLEEEVNLLASEYGRKVGMGAEGGLETYMGGMDKVLSMEGLESGFLGFLGGMGQTGLTNLANTSKYNPLSRVKTDSGYISKYDFMKSQAAAQQEILSKYEKMGANSKDIQKLTNAFNSADEQLKDTDELREALINRDEAKIKEIQGRGLGYQAIEAFMNGTTEQFIDTLNKVTEELVATAPDAASAKQYKDRGQAAVTMVSELEKKYNNNEILINRLNVKGDPDNVAKYKNWVKFKVNSLNAKQWMAQHSMKSMEDMLFDGGTVVKEGEESSPVEKYAAPYVKKQKEELKEFGNEYAKLMSVENAQANYDQWLKENEVLQKEINKKDQEGVELDNEIELFKQAITDAGYSQKTDENVVDLPGIGRVRGVQVAYEKTLYRLTREKDGTLSLVPVEDTTKPSIPFNREFLKANLNKLGIISAEDAKKVINAKRQQRFKRTQIESINSILTDYESKKASLQKEIESYETQIQDVLKNIEDLKKQIREGIRDKQMKISLQKDIKRLEETVKTGNEIIKTLTDQRDKLTDAQQELTGLKDFYIEALQTPFESFMSPAQVRNELKRKEAENYLLQKDREILEDSEKEINEAIFYIDQAIERLRTKQDALLKAINSLKLSDTEAIKKYKQLTKITSELTELEKDLKEYKEDLRLKQEASALQKSINMLDLHLEALKKRAENLYTAPQGYEDNPVEGSDTILEDSQEKEVYDQTAQKKSTSIFYTTGMNVVFDRNKVSDTYIEVDGKYIPKITDNTLERNWFERLDLEGIKEGERLMVIRYQPDAVDDTQVNYNNIIKRKLPPNYTPTNEDVFVVIVKDGKLVSYKDNPLIATLSLPYGAFPTNLFKDVRVNVYGIINAFSKARGGVAYYKTGNSYYEFIKDGKKTIIDISSEESQKEILDFIREQYKENLSNLKTGDILDIQGVTVGNPLRQKKMENGKLVNDYRPFKEVFKKKFAIVDGKPNFTIQTVVGTGTETTGNFIFKGQTYTAPVGTAVIMNEDKNSFRFIYNRTLNDQEIDTVLQLLTEDQNKFIKLPEGKYMIINGEKATELPVFPYTKATKGGKNPVSLLNTLINYGVKDIKNKSLREGDIYRSQGTIYYKHNGMVKSIPVSQITDELQNKDLRDFLSTKRLPINKHLAATNKLFFKISTKTVDGKPQYDFKSYSSYAEFILETARTNNYETEAGQTTASKNIIIKTDDTGNLIVNQAPQKIKTTPKEPVEAVTDSYEKMETPPAPIEVVTPKGVRKEFPANPLQRFNKMKLAEFPDGLYQIQESIVDVSDPARPQQEGLVNSYFVVKGNKFYPAPKGYNSMSSEEINVLQTSPELTLKNLAFEEDNKQHSFSIIGYAVPKTTQSAQQAAPAPVTPASVSDKKADIERRRKEELISAVTTPISYEEFAKTKPQSVIVNNFDVYQYDKDLKKYVLVGAASSTGTSLESIAAREEGAKDIEFFKDKSLKLDTVNFFWSERTTGRSPITRLTSYKKRTNQGRIDERVGDKLVEINAKYDAELAALKVQPAETATKPIPTTSAVQEPTDFSEEAFEATLTEEAPTQKVENLNTIEALTKESILSKLNTTLETAGLSPLAKVKIQKLIKQVESTDVITPEIENSFKEMCR